MEFSGGEAVAMIGRSPCSLYAASEFFTQSQEWLCINSRWAKQTKDRQIEVKQIPAIKHDSHHGVFLPFVIVVLILWQTSSSSKNTNER